MRLGGRRLEDLPELAGLSRRERRILVTEARSRALAGRVGREFLRGAAYLLVAGIAARAVTSLWSSRLWLDMGVIVVFLVVAMEIMDRQRARFIEPVLQEMIRQRRHGDAR